MKTTMKTAVLIAAGLWFASSPAGRAGDAYVFASFRGNGQDGLHLAWSRDGLVWKALHNDESFLKPSVGGKLMRDPCILRGPDGVHHMVWTTGWHDKGIGVAHSKDLVHWSEQKFVPVMRHEPKARNCWAPEIIWDPREKRYVIFWATTIPGRFPETARAGDDGWNHRIYCTTTRDFVEYSATKLFYDPGFNVIDATIVPAFGKYYMIAKDETRHPPAKNLFVSVADRADGPWKKLARPFTPKGLWVEGPSVLEIQGHWYVYFDAYATGHYGAMRTADFKTWEDVSGKLKVPRGMRHGTAFPVTPDVLAGLLRQPEEAPLRQPSRRDGRQ